MKRLRLAADQRKIILGHAEERGRFSAGRLLAVKAVTDGDEGGTGIEVEVYGAARATTGIFLCHRKLLCCKRTVCARYSADRRNIDTDPLALLHLSLVRFAPLDVQQGSQLR